MFAELTALIIECEATPGYPDQLDPDAPAVSKHSAHHREQRLAQMRAAYRARKAKYHACHREQRLAQMKARHAASRLVHIQQMRDRRKRLKEAKA